MDTEHAATVNADGVLGKDMKVGVIGGTGDFGGGLALRLADAGHEVFVGSRDEERGSEAADSYAEQLGTDVGGGSNREAAGYGDVAVLAVPYAHAVSTAEELSDWLSGVLVTPVVAMRRGDEGFVFEPEEESASHEVRDAVDVPVAGAFHNVAAGKLQELDEELDVDVVVYGDDDAVDVSADLVDSTGARALEVEGFEVAPQVESVTPLLINVGISSGMKDLGLRFV